MVFQLQLDVETVQQAHPSKPILVEPGTSVREVFQLLKKSDQGSVLVHEQPDGKLVGIFTERDVVKLMASQANLDQPVSQVMTRDIVAIQNSDTVKTAITEMAKGGYRRLPIVDAQGRPVGLLKVSGILRYLVEHVPKSVYNLPPRPHHSTQQREGA